MDRTIVTEKYRFDEKGHIHQFKRGDMWFPLIGVTTALGVIAKPALIQWSANMAVDFLETAYKAGMTLTDELFRDARSAHTKRKVEGGKKGTDVHQEIEKLLNRAIKEGNGFMGRLEKSPVPQIQKFINWARENKIRFLESEKHVYSEKLWIGGILDMVIEWDKKILIADIKTGFKIYNDAFFQMGAYDLCLEEMGTKVNGYLVINLKKTGEMDLEMAGNRDINKEAFLSALTLYKITQISLA